MKAVATHKLADVANILSGYAFDSSCFADSGDLPIVRIRDVVRGYSNTFYTGDFSETFVVNNGDLLIGMDGEFNTALWRGGRSVLNQRVCKVIPDETVIEKAYLYYLLPKELKAIEDATSFVTVKHLSVKSLQTIEIPLPPLPEQKRIAAILDKANSIRRKRLEAVRLTEELLRSVFLDMFGDPVTNPKGWDKCKLGDVVDKIESGWSPVCEERRAEVNEWGVLKLGAVTSCRYLDSENKALLAGTTLRPDLEVKAGDLLFTRKNTYDLVAASALVFSTHPKLMLSDLIFRLRFKNDAAVTSEYLWALLTNPGKRKQVQSLAGGSSGSMPNISKAKLMEQMLEVPPMALQEKYSKIVHRNHSIRIKLEAAVHKSEALFNSLLQSAFNGAI